MKRGLISGTVLILAAVVIAVLAGAGFAYGYKELTGHAVIECEKEVVYEEEEEYIETEQYTEEECRDILIPYTEEDCNTIREPYKDTDCYYNSYAYSVESYWYGSCWEWGDPEYCQSVYNDPNDYTCYAYLELENYESMSGTWEVTHKFYEDGNEVDSQTEDVFISSNGEEWVNIWYNCLNVDITADYNVDSVPEYEECETDIKYRDVERCEDEIRYRSEEECEDVLKHRNVTKTRMVEKTKTEKSFSACLGR